VPEHFNAPWHIAKSKGLFAEKGVEVEWTDYPGGTGDMCKALEQRDVDVAIMLTEGTLVKALQQPKIKIIGLYLSTPAIWGVHTGKESCKFEKIEEMKEEATFAISRMGSGSHLMAYVLAEQLGWPTDNLRFKEVGGLKGAIEELPKDGSLVFMWEKFTTLPQVVDGTFKRVGELLTPWPFFVIAVNADFIQEDGAREDFSNVLEVVKKEADAFKSGGQSTLDYVKEHYKIENDAASEWLSSVSWACELGIDMEMLANVGATLHRLDKIKTEDGSPPTTEALQATLA